MLSDVHSLLNSKRHRIKRSFGKVFCYTVDYKVTSKGHRTRLPFAQLGRWMRVENVQFRSTPRVTT
jgi:hypothetical protein